MRYAPNPVHKREWTEAGQPLPRSDKTPCPTDITAVACDALLQSSIPEDQSDPRARRYAVRRAGGDVELFAAQVHSTAGQEPLELHGYPVPTAPASVLRVLRDRGDLSPAEYRRFIRSLS